MSGSKFFSGSASVKDFVLSQGEFIYAQLIGLEETSKKNDRPFAELPVLAALRDESIKRGNFVQSKPGISSGTLKIGGENGVDSAGSSVVEAEENEDAKLAKLLQEEEYWKSMKQRKRQGPASVSSKYYIKINEDEIANDYPLPAYYKNSIEETDEFIVFDNEFDIYIDVTIFGSGVMSEDDGSGFCLDSDGTSSGPGAQDADGMPIYLSAIKEWMIELGASMVSISIRTDMAWYRLGKPSKQYALWYEPILRTAKIGRSIITMLKDQSRVARLSFRRCH
ncbi:hypothetical protein GBA52_023115 [Prunus armeniaca]|nr:hypothetical protein GBA52_023115 [Prunus armeniaca]